MKHTVILNKAWIILFWMCVIHANPNDDPEYIRSIMDIYSWKDPFTPYWKDPFHQYFQPTNTLTNKGFQPQTTSSMVNSAEHSSQNTSNPTHRIHSTGIPWAYTFGMGQDGSAWIFLYEQKPGNMAYFRDRLYYNTLGEKICKRLGIMYLGSDSGVFQRKETYNTIIGVFDRFMRKKILKHFHFERQYHDAGRKILVRTARGLQYHQGIDIGNGHGLHYVGDGKDVQNISQLLTKKTPKNQSFFRKHENKMMPLFGFKQKQKEMQEMKQDVLPNHVIHIQVG